MITPSKLPFSLTFSGGWDKGVKYFTAFTDDPDELAETLKPGLSLTENQDILIRFDGPRDFRFTMDGLDVVTIPGSERVDGQTYIRPFRRGQPPLLLFEGADFPLVPGYYVITVTDGERNWYGLLEITPKYMGKQSWQDMRDELTDEIRHISFDFMKKNIHISKNLEGSLGLSGDLLLKFYAISDESQVVLSVLDELSHTANARLCLTLRQVRQNERKIDPHMRPQHVKEREGAPHAPAIYTEITRNVPENRFAKAILLRLDRLLDQFLLEIEKPLAILHGRQAELAAWPERREYKTGERALNQLLLYRERARRIRISIHRVALSSWFEEAGNHRPDEMPMALFMDPRYSVLYRLYKNLASPEKSFDISSFYQFRWKRTDKLYELWGLEVHLTYDGLIPDASADTDRDRNPLYTNNAHRQPDLRLDYYKETLYYGSLVADFKYRDILFLWKDETRSGSLRHQFNAYRDMNTRFYRNMTETASLRDSRPVKEVWAIFPRAIPGAMDEDYSLKFIPLAPGLTGNEKLAEELEEYLSSLSAE